jgi:hypothetical protein
MTIKAPAHPEQFNCNTQSLVANCAPDVELRKCHEAINSIDCVCQTQLGQISSLVSIMLRAMESPDWWEHPDKIVDALGLLQYTADDCMNYVNGMAEAVGSNYVDDIERGRINRIWDAFRRANQKEVANV